MSKNILVICSDQHSARVQGSYGNDIIKTPNLDALAKAGTQFENAYCNSPICIPSRACMATGRHVYEHKVWDNAYGYDGTQADSWGHRLREQGFTATTFGKLHYQPDFDHGFEEHNPMHLVPGSIAQVYSLLRKESYQFAKQRQHILDAKAGRFNYTDYDEDTALRASRWIKESASQLDKPWASFVSFTYPHYPFVAPEEFVNLYNLDDLPLPVRYKEKDWVNHPHANAGRKRGYLEEPFSEKELRSVIQAYYGMVSFMDAQVGKVMDALSESGQLENTIVVYTSDHGEMLGDYGTWYKSLMYEPSVRVPTIITGQGIPKAKSCRTNVSHVDLFQTIVETVGADYSEKDGDLSGRSLVSIANDEDRERVVLSEYHSIGSSSGIFMLKKGDLKFNHYVGLEPELFNLANDPFEENNLAHDKTLLATMEQELKTILDPEAVDAQAFSDQAAMLEAMGGREHLTDPKNMHSFTPPPQEN